MPHCHCGGRGFEFRHSCQIVHHLLMFGLRFSRLHLRGGFLFNSQLSYLLQQPEKRKWQQVRIRKTNQLKTQMASSLLSVESADILKAVAFAAVFLFTKKTQACIVLIAHALCEYLYISALNGFYTAIAISAMYACLASSKITIKSEIRDLFILLSCVNWLCAADIELSNGQLTYFELCYPWFINGLDLLVFYHLLPRGGLRSVGSYLNSGFSRMANL